VTPIAKLSAAMLVCFAAAVSVVQAGSQSVFQTLDGQADSPDNYIGQGSWSVVMLWAHGCHVCNQEAEQYAQLHDDLVDKNGAVLGISIDGLDERPQAQQFVTRHDLPFPNLIAETGAVMRWFQEQTGTRFLGTPTILIYGPSGELKAAQAGAVSGEVIENFIADNS